jgi:hypothetical protein
MILKCCQAFTDVEFLFVDNVSEAIIFKILDERIFGDGVRQMNGTPVSHAIQYVTKSIAVPFDKERFVLF